MSRDFKKAIKEKKNDIKVPQFDPIMPITETKLEAVVEKAVKKTTRSELESVDDATVLVSVRLPKSLHKKVKLYAVENDINRY